jgi:hypothetical protein
MRKKLHSTIVFTFVHFKNFDMLYSGARSWAGARATSEFYLMRLCNTGQSYFNFTSQNEIFFVKSDFSNFLAVKDDLFSLIHELNQILTASFGFNKVLKTADNCQGIFT